MLGYKMLRAVSLHEIVKSGHDDAHPDPRFSTIGRKASNVFTVMQIRSVTGDHCTATYTVSTTVMRRDAVPARARSPVIFIPRSESNRNWQLPSVVKVHLEESW